MTQMEELSYIGSDRSLRYSNLSLCCKRFFLCFVLGVDIVLLVLSYFCRFQHWGSAEQSVLSLIQLRTCDALAQSYTSPGFPNLMANKGDIHLTRSEIVMATLSLLSLVYTDARQPFRLHSPLILPSLLPFITGSLSR